MHGKNVLLVYIVQHTEQMRKIGLKLGKNKLKNVMFLFSFIFF